MAYTAKQQQAITLAETCRVMILTGGPGTGKTTTICGILDGIGNRRNCDLTNLYLLSRADNARRRTLEETPEARKARLAKAQTSRNKSIRRDRIRLHWGLEPLGKLVKRW